MVFPYGEWIIFSLTVFSWLENHPSRKLFNLLAGAWLLGKMLEIFVTANPWHWQFSRLGAMTVLAFWAWLKAEERRIFPLILTSLTLIGQDLFLLNEPGILQYDQWFFSVVLITIAWLSAQEFWGMAFAMTGAIIINQFFIVFLFAGIVKHVDLPDSFTWHFTVAAIAVNALVGGGFLKIIFAKVREYLSLKKWRKPEPTEETWEEAEYRK